MGQVHVGTSSWADPGFVEEWYPKGLPARERLPFYSERFDAVEVNSTFYAVPDEHTVKRWAAVTPPDFTFDVKLHRLLSRHAATLDSLPPDLRERARVTGPRGRVALDAGLESAMAEATLAVVEPLREAGKLSTFLLQLSPSFTPHEHRLEELEPLLEMLAPTPVAIELRRRGWVHEERLEDTLKWYEAAGAAWVSVDSPPGDAPTIMPPVDAVTRDDVAYFRAHGRNTDGYLRGQTVAERFGWKYSDEELREIAGRVGGLAELSQDVRTMLNNNRGSDAPTSARRFRELLGQDPGPEPASSPAGPQGQLDLDSAT